MEVVTASRDFGAALADSATVRFEVYELQANTKPLGPTYLSRHVRTVNAKRLYCDVSELPLAGPSWCGILYYGHAALDS